MFGCVCVCVGCSVMLYESNTPKKGIKICFLPLLPHVNCCWSSPLSLGLSVARGSGVRLSVLVCFFLIVLFVLFYFILVPFKAGCRVFCFLSFFSVWYLCRSINSDVLLLFLVKWGWLKKMSNRNKINLCKNENILHCNAQFVVVVAIFYDPFV